MRGRLGRRRARRGGGRVGCRFGLGARFVGPLGLFNFGRFVSVYRRPVKRCWVCVCVRGWASGVLTLV